MTKQHWSKFFWNDWRGDPRLRVCSFAARGLWMEMLCVMAESGGYFLINGVKPSNEQTARLCAGSPEEVAGLLDDLERMNVFSINRDGVIYSRRIVRDQKKRGTAADNGKLAGSVSPSKQRERRDSTPPNGKSPESRVQIPDTNLLFPKLENLPRKGRGREYPKAFEDFWAAWMGNPNDTKASAYKSWRKPVVAGLVGAEELTGIAKVHTACMIADKRTPDKIPHLQTWFNREGWTAKGLQTEQIPGAILDAEGQWRCQFTGLPLGIDELEGLRDRANEAAGFDKEQRRAGRATRARLRVVNPSGSRGQGQG